MTSLTVSRWNLQDLLPDGIGQLDSILDEIESTVQKIENIRGRLSDGFPISDFLELLHTIETMHELTAHVGGYAYLNYAGNTQDSAAISLLDRVEKILTSINNRTLFFGLWFKSLTEESAQRYIKAAGDLSYHLKSIRRFKPYTLSEAEEKIINLKDVNGGEVLVKIYEILTNGFSFNLEVDGEVKKLTRDGLTQYYHHANPQVRAATYQELYRVYGENKAVLAQIYFSLVRDWGSEGVELRG